MKRPSLGGLFLGGLALSCASLAVGLPRPDHTVVVVFENHSYSQIIGNGSAPYINSLRARGASFTNSHAVGHPSEPNYLALFAGTTENISDDSCPHAFSDPNLASSLAAAGLTFIGYSESMPNDGYTGCGSGNYARKHNPWVNFTNVPPTSNLTFADFPPDYANLPTVSIVVPNLCNDMHNCSVGTGDSWLASHLDGYIQWASANNSLFVLTFDEDGSNTPTNQITTIFVGPMVVSGDNGMLITHYNVLRTVEDLYGAAPTGSAASVAAITGIWEAPTPTPTATATPTVTPTPADAPRGQIEAPTAPRRLPIWIPFRPTIAPAPTAMPVE